MKYRTLGKTGERVSVLGYGCMRFPMSNSENNGSIIVEDAVAQLRYAIDEGLNYVDTAYFYHDCKSEEVVGKALKDGYREKVLLATKSPFGGFKSGEDFREHLETQLKRLEVDMIDCYLLHCVTQDNWESSAIANNLLSEMEKAREQGKIRYIGFSYHDNSEFFRRVIDYYPWDFCQIQFNYIDVNNQAGLEGLKYAAAKGMGVIVMEPLLGGRLCEPRLPVNVKNALPKDKTPAQSGFDFIWNLPEVSLLLSGMSNMEQVRENLQYADESGEGKLSGEELKIYEKARNIYNNSALVSCTACEYCMPCPSGVNIPECFRLYNKTVYSSRSAREEYASLNGSAALCAKCGECEAKCPQKIGIISELEKALEILSGE